MRNIRAVDFTMDTHCSFTTGDWVTCRSLADVIRYAVSLIGSMNSDGEIVDDGRDDVTIDCCNYTDHGLVRANIGMPGSTRDGKVVKVFVLWDGSADNRVCPREFNLIDGEWVGTVPE